VINGKKVLFLTTTDNMIWQFLLPHIKHLQDAGNTVECACAKTGFWFDELKQKHDLVMHETSFSRSPYKFLQNKRAFKKLKDIVQNGKFDLIHCHQPVGGVMGRRVGAKCGVPVLYIAHGFHFFKGAPLHYNLIYKTIEKRYAKKTDALVTMNEEDFVAAKKFKAKRVYKINGIGFEPTKMSAIPYDKKELQTELGLSDDDVVLISVGELNKNKNHKVVIEAVAKLEAKNVKYIVCGQGPRLEEYKTLIKELGAYDRVKLLGYRKDVRNILKISDVFIMPSFREGLPMSMMEAMYEGLPIITSSIRGCVDLVADNDNGLLVDLKDKDGFLRAIKKLADDKELRTMMGKRNKEIIKEFYIEEVLKQMENIYDETIK